MKQSKLSLKGRKRMWGFVFISPWIFGFIVFFLIPLIQSITFSFSKVTISNNGVITKFTGFTNWKYVLYENADYTNNLGEAISSFVYTLPIVIILSLCIAMVLNQNFKGRIFARAIFFLPALMAGGMIMSILNDNIMSSATMEAGGSTTYFSQVVDFEAIITGLGLPESITGIISRYMSGISTLVWNCGVQIILFISGLQSIPKQLYEVAKVEGATSWETFWFVTFPMLTNILLVTMVYTTIDLFTSTDNAVMTQTYNLLINKQNYSDGSAMLWIYLSIIGIVLSIVFYLLNKLFIKKWSTD